MSDVLVRGMKMPFTCLTCDFHKCAGGVGDFCSLTKKRQFRFKNRPKDCPLVPVPPHGRLIDADAFDERVRIAGGMAEEELSDDFKDGVQTTLLMLKTQRTIIPAEESVI